MEIYKLILRSGLNTDVYPRIYFNQETARKEARELLGTDYEDMPGEVVENVVICRERPDTALGWFTTCGMERIKSKQ